MTRQRVDIENSHREDKMTRQREYIQTRQQEYIETRQQEDIQAQKIKQRVSHKFIITQSLSIFTTTSFLNILREA